MTKEHQIALKTINENMDTFRWFTYENLLKKIQNNGGILRTSPGVTIKDYLDYLVEVGLLIKGLTNDKRHIQYIFNPVAFPNDSKLKKDLKYFNLKKLVNIFGCYYIRTNPALLTFVLQQRFNEVLIKKIFNIEDLSKLDESISKDTKDRFPELISFIKSHTFN